jgi:hypothetical protein
MDGSCGVILKISGVFKEIQFEAAPDSENVAVTINPRRR